MLGEDDDGDSAAPLTVLVGNGGPLDGPSPRNTQMIYVSIDGEPRYAGYAYADHDDPVAAYIVARSPILEVGSPAALSLAKACIDECAQGHPRCIAISTSHDPLLPTRVVDCTDPARPRLATTRGQRGSYLALSYVWGEPQPHSTTMANVANYTEGIDPACLPQTIRDAIGVTHALGVRALWADSLCIIQDSDEDKRREIGRMHHIYRYAHLTLVAASARRVGEGFLQPRRPAPGDVALPVLCPPQEPAARKAGTVHLSATHTQVEDDVEHYRHDWDPIGARGWCMQEYFMSPRALLFTSETLQFRCQTATQNVGGSYYDPTWERRVPDALFLPDPDPGPGPEDERAEAWAAAYKAWLDIVEDYSRRLITAPADKLVACGALAEGFQRVLRTDYLAGLWRATLLNDLLWFRPGGPQPPAPRPRRYRAPSWSWAAVDGEVWVGGDWSGMKRLGGAAVAEVVKCEVALEDDALPFGQVTAGSVVLRGASIPCVVRSGEQYGLPQMLLPSPTQAQRWESGLEEAVDVDQVDEGSMTVGWVRVDNEADLGVRRAWALPISQGNGRLEGLVVARVDSGHPGNLQSGGIYRRVGRFDVYRELQDTELESYWNGTLPLVDVELV